MCMSFSVPEAEAVGPSDCGEPVAVGSVLPLESVTVGGPSVTSLGIVSVISLGIVSVISVGGAVGVAVGSGVAVATIGGSATIVGSAIIVEEKCSIFSVLVLSTLTSRRRRNL